VRIVVGELQVHQLHALDLVAQAGGFLELQVGGGLAHAALEVLERGLEVGADEGAGVLLDPVGAGQLVQRAALIGAGQDLLECRA
jgi:hypothetical protein